MIDVDDVCTHEQLGDEAGGLEELENVLPVSYAGSSAAPREAALRVVLKACSRRTPPIYEADFLDVTELRDAVAYGALERIYREAMTGADSVYALKRAYFEKKLHAELLGLAPRVQSSGGRATVFSIAMERR